jgi:tRNA(fMet)-specific endonuclease VapC
MSGEIALDTSVAVRFLNGDTAIVARVLGLPEVVLPIVAVGELLFGAENSTRPLQNLPRYLEFIEACVVLSKLALKNMTMFSFVNKLELKLNQAFV